MFDKSYQALFFWGEFQMAVDHGNFNISSFHFVDWMGLFKCLHGLQTEHC